MISHQGGCGISLQRPLALVGCSGGSIVAVANENSGGGIGRVVWLVTHGHQMSSNMGGSQHSAISFRRDKIASCLNRYRLLLLFLLVCYL